jgi:hypothetical protein
MESAHFTARHPGSFGGVQSLRRYSGQSLKDVRKWLSAQNAYTIHKPNRIHFERRKTYSKGINDLFQADLVDLSNISKYTDGYR